MDALTVSKRAVIFLMVFFGLFTLVKVAEAVTFLGNQKVCTSLALFAFTVAGELRDQQTEWAEFEPWLTTQLEAAKGNDDSFIKDDSDVTWVLSAFKQVWDGKQTPYDAAVTLESNCLKVPAKRVML